VDHLSSSDAEIYELVTFKVQHEGEWVEQANYLRTTAHPQRDNFGLSAIARTHLDQAAIKAFNVL
jgi:hypothetical protein